MGPNSNCSIVLEQPSSVIQELQGSDPSPAALVCSALTGNASLPPLQAFSPPFVLPLENVILSCLTRFTVDSFWTWP